MKVMNNELSYIVSITPIHYLRFVQEYKNIFIKKNNEFKLRKEKLTKGLQKLVDSKLCVQKMQTVLNDKKIIVSQSQTESEVMLEKIVTKKVLAEKREI